MINNLKKRKKEEEVDSPLRFIGVVVGGEHGKTNTQKVSDCVSVSGEFGVFF